MAQRRIDPEVLDDLLKSVEASSDLQGVLRQLSKQLIEWALDRSAHLPSRRDK